MARAKAAHSRAAKACEGKAGAERRDCVVRELCAERKDAKACEERATRLRQSREEARRACEKEPAKCEQAAKERAARREKIREACRERKGEALRACIREQVGGK